MKRKALFMALSSKVNDGEIALADKLELSAPKTKEIFSIVNVFFGKSGNNSKVLIALPTNDEVLMRSAKNLRNTKALNSANLNVVDLLSHKYLLMTKDSVEAIKRVFLR